MENIQLFSREPIEAKYNYEKIILNKFNYFELQQNDELEISLDFFYKTVINNKNAIYLSKNVIKKQNYIKICLDNKNTFDFIYFFQKANKETLITLIGKPFKLFCQFENNCYSLELPKNIDNIKLISFNGMPIVVGDVKNQKYLAFFEENEKQFFQCLGSYKMEQDQLYCVQNCASICKHGKEFCFYIENGNIKEKTYKLVYLKNRPIIPKTNLQIAFAFLECIMLEDYELAKKFLRKEKKLSAKHANNFFGKFNNIDYIGNNTFTLTNIDNSEKNIKFKFENNTIYDILL